MTSLLVRNSASQAMRPIDLLYESREIDRIRQVAEEILVMADRPLSQSAQIISAHLKADNIPLSCSIDYLWRLKKFGLDDDRPSPETLYRYPYLCYLSDRYTQSQLTSVALGQDPKTDPVRSQWKKNEYYLSFRRLRDMFEDAAPSPDFYKTRRGLQELYCEYQIYRIRKVANFIVNKENAGVTQPVLTEKINQQYRELEFARYGNTVLSSFVNFGNSTSNSSIVFLAKLPLMSAISEKFYYEDLRQVALGQCPESLKREEYMELKSWRNTLQSATLTASSLDLAGWKIHADADLSLSEYLKKCFRQNKLDWEEGIASILSHVSEPEAVRHVLEGHEKKPSSSVVRQLARSLTREFEDDFNTEELMEMIER